MFPSSSWKVLIWWSASIFYWGVFKNCESVCFGGLVRKQRRQTLIAAEGDGNSSPGNVRIGSHQPQRHQPSFHAVGRPGDGNVSQGHDVIAYKRTSWARSEIQGRCNAAASEMICRTSTTDLAGSCANANCPNYSSGGLVDFLAVTSGVALFLARWVVRPICTGWQDGAPMGPEILCFWVIVLFCVSRHLKK